MRSSLLLLFLVSVSIEWVRVCARARDLFLPVKCVCNMCVCVCAHDKNFMQMTTLNSIVCAGKYVRSRLFSIFKSNWKSINVRFLLSPICYPGFFFSEILSGFCFPLWITSFEISTWSIYSFFFFLFWFHLVLFQYFLFLSHFQSVQVFFSRSNWLPIRFHLCFPFMR